MSRTEKEKHKVGRQPDFVFLFGPAKGFSGSVA